jgi:hypothetical protein
MTRPVKPPPKYDRTGTQRGRRAVERGRRINAVLQNREAIDRWDALVQQHGSQRAAIEALLLR